MLEVPFSMLEINNDFKFIGYNYRHVGGKIMYDYSHIIHLVIAIVISFMFGFLVSYAPLLFYNVINGCKKWRYEYKPHNMPDWLECLRKRLFYSYKFSLVNALIWDLGGSLIGMFLRMVVSWCFI